MRRLCAVILSCVAGIAAVGLFSVDSADAYPDFYKMFMIKYVGEDEAARSDAQKALELEVKRVKRCAVCHDPRKDENGKASKKNRNPYGIALSKRLTKKDRKNDGKTLEELLKIEDQKPADAKQEDPTFGELIKQGKLPFEYKE